MNTIYRIVRHASTGKWVVASELAKGRKKKTSVYKSAVMALALASTGIGMPVAFAADAAEDVEASCERDESETAQGCAANASPSNLNSPRFAGGGGDDGSAGGNDLRTAIGSGVNVSADNSVGIGTNLRVQAANAIALGSDYNTGNGVYTPAISASSTGAFVVSPTGNGHAANSPNSVAILGITTNAPDAVAIGNAAQVFYGNGVAIGESAWSYQAGSVALGADALAYGSNSVALGAGSSVAFSQQNVVSIGNSTTQRRIIYVAPGQADTDAVNVSQIKSVVDSLGGTFDAATGTITGPTFIVQGASETTVTGAVTALDNAVSANATDINNLDTRVTTVEGDITNIKTSISDLQAGAANGIAYDDSSQGTVTFAGAAGTLLTNVANGQIASGSMDAVNGGQLSDIRDQLQGQIGNLNDRVDDVESAIAEGSSGGGTGPGNDAGGNPISNVGDGIADTDAANVGQLNEYTQQAIEASQNYTNSQVQVLSDSLDTFKGEVNARFNKQDIRISRVGAMSAAMSQMAFSTQGINTPNRVGVGIGTQGGQQAIAVGYSRSIKPNVNLSFGGSASGSEVSAGVGAGIGW